MKRLIMLCIAILGVAGLYDAVRNLPVISGCAFYGDCPGGPDVTASDGSSSP
jgi:hypothetical protein